MTDVAVIGLGKLGLCMAVALASKGHRVVGVDVVPEWVDKINGGGCPVNEPGLGGLLAPLVKSRMIRCTTDYREAVKTAISFVAVNTPLNPDNTMEMEQIRDSSESLGKALKGSRGRHIVAVSSTILPTTCDEIIRPILEKRSGKKCGKDFGVVANPVFIALTTVVHDYLRPPFVIIGSYDDASGDVLQKFYSGVCENRPPVVRTTPIMGEVIKFAHNAFMTTKISFINEMADMCARLRGGDGAVLREFFKIGGDRPGKFFMTGLGFGGPCFPKDLRTFISFLKSRDIQYGFLQSIHDSNSAHAGRIVDLVESAIGRIAGMRVAFLGLAYKPQTDIVENSFSFDLVERLLKRGAKVVVYDPPAIEAARRVLGKRVAYGKNLTETLKGADLCVVATAQDEFKTIAAETFRRHMKQSILLDVWGLYDARKFRKMLKHYLVVGVDMRNRRS